MESSGLFEHEKSTKRIVVSVWMLYIRPAKIMDEYNVPVFLTAECQRAVNGLGHAWQISTQQSILFPASKKTHIIKFSSATS